LGHPHVIKPQQKNEMSSEETKQDSKWKAKRKAEWLKYMKLARQTIDSGVAMPKFFPAPTQGQVLRDGKWVKTLLTYQERFAFYLRTMTRVRELRRQRKERYRKVHDPDKNEVPDCICCRLNDFHN
jgi:hypothetical protein